jgi:hypothetical protein
LNIDYNDLIIKDATSKHVVLFVIHLRVRSRHS